MTVTNGGGNAPSVTKGTPTELKCSLVNGKKGNTSTASGRVSNNDTYNAENSRELSCTYQLKESCLGHIGDDFLLGVTWAFGLSRGMKMPPWETWVPLDKGH